MSDIGIIVLLYAVAVLILTAEIFIPSHGILSVAGVAFLLAAVTKTFFFAGRDAGLISLLACLLFLPAFAYVSIRLWPKTPLGRRIAPPNPILTAADAGVPVAELSQLIGRTGRAVTQLRPVGICDFGGRRVSCVTEFGVVDAGAAVVASGFSGGTLTVVPSGTSGTETV
jgi:membrane-bound ClpP family serine protease